MSKTTFGMHQHNRGNSRGRGKAVTVIQANVQYSYLRTAKITFYVVLAVSGLVTAVVSTQYLHPILVVPFALAAGTLIGCAVASIIAIWPVLRAIWWWLPEIAFVMLTIGGWMFLQHHLGPILTGLIYASIIAPIGLIPAVRRYTLALAWCLIVRHRLRTCFMTFLPTDRHGHLPFIGFALPTPVGERVWVWLRPGLSQEHIEARLDKVAVACWAASVSVTRARTSNAAAICLDIKRRQVLDGLVGSPLIEDLPPSEAPALPRPVAAVPAQLDFADVPDTDDTTPTERPTKKNARPPAVGGTPVMAVQDNPDLDWV
ncbi:hypothetical protein AB0I81_34965 [Nonomuraea sp. NPDC050404]|uniref:hypothetical protein n=1 Tax=Nonomuraea sp. NPDC050404 TaxID=3155783 RepID=UPI0033DC64C3